MQRWERGREVGAQIEAVRDRFAQWRQSGRRGRRIPDELWQAAVELAQRQGVHRTVLALGLNAQALKAQVAKSRGSSAVASARPVRFVELAMVEPALEPGAGWVVEIEDGHGARLRVKLGGRGTPDLGELTRAFLREPR